MKSFFSLDDWITGADSLASKYLSGGHADIFTTYAELMRVCVTQSDRQRWESSVSQYMGVR